MLRLLPPLLLLAAARTFAGEPPAVRTSPERLVNGSAFVLQVTPAVPWRSVACTFERRKVLLQRDSAGGWAGIAGVDFDAAAGPHELVLQAVPESGAAETFTIPLPVERIERPTSALRVPKRFVEPNARTRARIAREREVKARLLSPVTPERLYHGRFVAPVAGETTEGYGIERLFNGKRQSVHYGLDYRASRGTPVRAMNGGRVVLSRDLFYEGGCVAVDHGLGFVTLYLHLSRRDVKEGAPVTKGQLLGLSGSSGRATGPHLHLAVRWQGLYLDPASLLALDPP